MTTLYITRGLPASGKTTWARWWVASDPEKRARVNRDDLRAMAHDSVHLKPSDDGAGTERAIMAVRDAAITALLKRGLDVVNDDTNLPLRTVRDLRRLATLHGAEFEVIDLTDVSLEDCRARNGLRDKPVPDDVIVDLHKRFIHKRPHPLPIPPEENESGQIDVQPYVPKIDKPKAIIVDIDGTVALMGTRSPFDETRVHEDRPNLPVIAAIQSMWNQGYELIFMSGRSSKCLKETRDWVREHVFGRQEPVDGITLHMRPEHDQRKDSIVKLELFNQRVRENYNVVGVFDDRDQVVKMWRDLGLTVFQVADGNF